MADSASIPRSPTAGQDAQDNASVPFITVDLNIGSGEAYEAGLLEKASLSTSLPKSLNIYSTHVGNTYIYIHYYHYYNYNIDNTYPKSKVPWKRSYITYEHPLLLERSTFKNARKGLHPTIMTTIILFQLRLQVLHAGFIDHST